MKTLPISRETSRLEDSLPPLSSISDIGLAKSTDTRIGIGGVVGLEAMGLAWLGILKICSQVMPACCNP